ncbi:MAG: hypothetical protein IPP15_12685 [Saprospiraceae bacterium]|uniref:Uncharacterized protein n=1 Tax=Candidatus Opimibacter skivensis TaxID=2982028 RepID=A0A9D7SWK3_9BACT|nr:hypothetical protein [Candidatus Opimibacter skivensis]
MGFESKYNVKTGAKGYEISITQQVTSIALKNQCVQTNGTGMLRMKNLHRLIQNRY